MATTSLAERARALERQMGELRSGTYPSEETRDWLNRVSGMFADDPVFDEAMRLGREYRESLQPKPKGNVRSDPKRSPARR